MIRLFYRSPKTTFVFNLALNKIFNLSSSLSFTCNLLNFLNFKGEFYWNFARHSECSFTNVRTIECKSAQYVADRLVAGDRNGSPFQENIWLSNQDTPTKRMVSIPWHWNSVVVVVEGGGDDHVYTSKLKAIGRSGVCMTAPNEHIIKYLGHFFRSGQYWGLQRPCKFKLCYFGELPGIGLKL